MNFRYMDKELHKKISRKGGITKGINYKNKELSFERVVKENLNTQEMIELYNALLDRAKKGNIKAFSIILKYLMHDS